MIKRNISSLLLIFILIGGLLAGCGSSSSSAGREETYEIIMTHELPESFFKHEYMEQFKNIVEDKSEGRLKVTIYPAGQLLTDSEAIQALGTGTVHMVWPVSAHLEALNEEYGVLSLPFGLSDELVLGNPEFMTELTELLDGFVDDKGIKILGLMRTAEGIILTKDKELKELDDLSGLKIRTVSGHVASDMISSFKASSVSMAATEIATSLSQGVIDGVNTSPDGWKDVVGSIAKYGFVVPEMQIFTYTIAADREWFENLPEDLQELIQTTIHELTLDQWKESIELDKQYIEEVTSDWGTVHYVPEDRIDEWKQATEEVHEKFGERFPDALEKFNEIVSKYQ